MTNNTETLSYSNPRMELVVADWPLGGSKRGEVTFRIEHKPGKGERAVRTSKDPRTGRVSQPKVLTYSVKQRIVDGSDGKTYIACLTMYGFVSIMRSDMQLQHESVFDGDPKYVELRNLFN